MENHILVVDNCILWACFDLIHRKSFSILFLVGFSDSRKSMKRLSSMSKNSQFFSFSHIPNSVIFIGRGSFSFLELSCGTTIAAEIGQAVVDLKRSSESSFAHTIIAEGEEKL